MPAGVSVCDIVTLQLKPHKIGAGCLLYCHADFKLKLIERTLLHFVPLSGHDGGTRNKACMLIAIELWTNEYFCTRTCELYYVLSDFIESTHKCNFCVSVIAR